jgi:hypothetical protein
MADRDHFDEKDSCDYNRSEECKGEKCNRCGKFTSQADKKYWEWKMSQ